MVCGRSRRGGRAREGGQAVDLGEARGGEQLPRRLGVSGRVQDRLAGPVLGQEGVGTQQERPFEIGVGVPGVGAEPPHDAAPADRLLSDQRGRRVIAGGP
ncbi:hypothetical protein [Nonomuraea salmonea]|uniref:hypothetical protein n=1 Tax=Nonomuraea salmonea TaxID=46181 RepID=UPI002FE787D6